MRRARHVLLACGLTVVPSAWIGLAAQADVSSGDRCPATFAKVAQTKLVTKDGRRVGRLRLFAKTGTPAGYCFEVRLRPSVRKSANQLKVTLRVKSPHHSEATGEIGYTDADPAAMWITDEQIGSGARGSVSARLTGQVNAKAKLLASLP
jgi:hypothetical protein